MTREQFRAQMPPYSIALDGFVIGETWFDSDTKQANFNHHEGVFRDATRATCGQVLLAVRRGLYDFFCDEHGPMAKLDMNDCDEDVCLSSFTLKNPHMCRSTMNLALNRLVSIEDFLDTTAGNYAFPVGLDILETMSWIFQPYHEFRMTGQLDSRRPEAFLAVIENVHGRITKYLAV